MSQLFNNNIKFDRIFNIATTSLRINRSHPYIARDRKWRVQFFLIMTLSFLCLFLLLYSLFSHEIKNGKYTEASKNWIMIIVALTVTYKYSILLRHQQSITELIRIVDEDYELAKEFPVEEQRIVEQYFARGVKVCLFWFYSGCSTCAVFPMKAVFLMGKSYFAGQFELVPMFDLTFPWIDEYKFVPVLFAMIFALALFFDCHAATMYVGFDPLIPIFMLHVCGQLDILKLRISKLLSNPDDSHELIREKLKHIIIKLQDLDRFIDVIKTNFTVLYEFNMKTTTFLIPLTAFQIREGEHFRLAVYSCGWEKHPDRRVRRSIQFMLMRATRPLVISTIFYAICLDTFAQMGREAYSIFNLMNAAWT